MPQSQLTIEPVHSRRHRSDFYRVKRELYRKDPHAVVTLRRLEWLQLDTRKNPFYKHAERELWVVYQGGQPVGRIGAFVDHLHNEFNGEKTGMFGFFESPNDTAVAKLLLDQAIKWLREHGCEHIRGPMNPSMKSEFGVLLKGHEFPPFIMMAHTPRYYADLIEGQGLMPLKRFFSFLNTAEQDDAEARARFSRLGEACVKLKKRFPELTICTGTKGTLEQMLRDINEIGNRVRSQGWGFVPLTEEELDFNVAQLKRIIDPKTVIGAYIDGRLVGYNVSIPNVNWAIQKCWGRADWIRFPQLLYWLRRIPEVRLIAVGVDPDVRAKGISALVTKTMTDRWEKYSRWEFGWIAEDNLASMASLDRALPLHQYKTYQLYEMPLHATGAGSSTSVPG